MTASTLIHDTARRGTAADLRRLIASGWDVNAVDTEGQTPLSLAEAYARQENAEVLRRAGAF